MNSRSQAVLLPLFQLVSIIGFTTCLSAGYSNEPGCGFLTPDFKYFAILPGVDEISPVGSIISSSEFKTYNIRNISLQPNDYFEPYLHLVQNGVDVDQEIRFRLIHELTNYLQNAYTSVLEYEYQLTCHDGTLVTSTLLLDIQDTNNLGPVFHILNPKTKRMIDWKVFQDGGENDFEYDINPHIQITDGDYLPENAHLSTSSCLIDMEHDCSELMAVTLSLVEGQGQGQGQGQDNNAELSNHIGYKYDVQFVLDPDFDEFLSLHNKSVMTITLTASDGVHQAKGNVTLEFVGRAEGGGVENSEPVETRITSLQLVLIIAGSAAALVALLTAALGVAIRRVRHQKKNLDKLTEADIREFREGTSVLTTGAGQRESLAANAPVLSKPYNNQFEISRDNLRIDETTTLGCGMFGTVMKGYVTIVGDQKLPVAVKTVKKNAGVLYFKSLLTELKIMSFIGKHPNIVCLIGACTQNIRKRELYVAVELCSNGNFRDYLKDRRDFFENMIGKDGKLNVRRNSLQSLQNGSVVHSAFYQTMTTLDLIRWAFQIANGMEFIASKKVIHGDLAARNILLDDNRVAKIADFGLSRRLIDYSNYNYTKKTQCPLPWKYMAIESLKDLQFSLKTDIWTFGVLLWEIFTLGQKPFSMHTWDEKFVAKLEAGLRLEPPKFAPKEISDIMVDCWTAEPTDRPSFFDIKRQISQLLHKQTDYEDIVGETGSAAGYGLIRRQHAYERVTILPPKIMERPDDAFIY